MHRNKILFSVKLDTQFKTLKILSSTLQTFTNLLPFNIKIRTIKVEQNKYTSHHIQSFNMFTACLIY